MLREALAEAIEATNDTVTLERWIALCATRSQEEIAAAVIAERTTLTSTAFPKFVPGSLERERRGEERREGSQGGGEGGEIRIF